MDVRPSEKRDIKGTKAFQEVARETVNEIFEQVFINRLTSYFKAID